GESDVLARAASLKRTANRAHGQMRSGRGQVGVCASCGKVLEFAGHVNLDLDLRLHREQEQCAGLGVVYRRTSKQDLVDFDRET
ncbi:MAG: hypothetical protein M3R54_08010, partial [Chloroflexota bacterium]|nr:hypothetical protein [Chloroflexota bacterium]